MRSLEHGANGAPPLETRIESRDAPRRSIVVDKSHMGRRASGVERVTRELFSDGRLAPLSLEETPAAASRPAMMFNQLIANPLRSAMKPDDVWVFPGYPPSPLFAFLPCEKVLYVHDLFLMTRWAELNWAARLYMAAPFRFALKRFRRFFVNSLTTGAQLRPLVCADAQILPFRPPAENVFGFSQARRARAKREDEPIVLGALGTVEPRKNFLGAAQIAAALGRRLGREVELHIVGRRGWGGDYDALSLEPHVRLHGFTPDALMPELTANWDAFLCTSNDEGLGLPLLEMQHLGLPTIAPDADVFREVLCASGVFIRTSEISEAAATIADVFARPGWRESAAELARRNLDRWNRLAEADRDRAIEFLSALSRDRAQTPRPSGAGRAHG